MVEHATENRSVGGSIPPLGTISGPIYESSAFVGAVMNHSVIVSRDLGIPCVVSVTGATRIIPDGAMVEIDGDTGTVTILSTALLAA